MLDLKGHNVVIDRKAANLWRSKSSTYVCCSNPLGTNIAGRVGGLRMTIDWTESKDGREKSVEDRFVSCDVRKAQ